MRLHLSSLLAILSVLVPYSVATTDSYIASEGPIAKAGVLANIGPSGSKSNGAKAGIVGLRHSFSFKYKLIFVPSVGHRIPLVDESRLLLHMDP